MHEVELLLNRQVVLGVTHYGLAVPSAALAHCPEKVAEYDTALRRPAPAAPPPLVAPRLVSARGSVRGRDRPCHRRPAGAAVLFYWPTDGWVRGTVALRSRAAPAGHCRPVRPAVGAGRSCCCD